MKYILIILFLACIANSKFLGQSSVLHGNLKEVHLLPHSHDDVGWLNTVQQIYDYGPGVKNIITSYVNALLKDERRKFVQVEIYYFKKWWNEQNGTTKENVRQLIKKGQLEFACAGWTMHDEATTYYEDIIDSMTGGHKFLYDEFKIIPKVGWQLDPFGHSSASTTIHHLMGFDSQFFARIDYQDIAKRRQERTMELVTIPYGSQNYPLFTHVTYHHYSAPSSFDFDRLRSDMTINSNNLVSKASSLVSYFKEQFKQYHGRVIAHTVGDDNEWSDAENYFTNYDLLINHINENKETFGMEIKYSTPNQYIQAVAEQEINYTTKRDDWFPYADKGHAYWTGYFTSRTAFKNQIRKSGLFYQQFKNYLHDKKDSQIINAIQQMSEVMGIMQHHDAVTGTAKQYVTQDYQEILSQQVNNLNKILHTELKKDIKEEINESIDNLFQCEYNSTQCNIIAHLQDSKTILITFITYNENQLQIKVKVPAINLKIIDQSNNIIQGDIICYGTDCTLYFEIKDIKYVKIMVATPDQSSAKLVKEEKAEFNENTAIKIDDDNQSFKLKYIYYKSNVDGQQNDGAYIFRPYIDSLIYGNIIESKIFTGQLLTEIYIKRDTVETWIRKFKNQQDIYEVESFVHSISIADNAGKNIVLVITTDIKSGDVFYTDSNGMDMQKRQKGSRETWKLQSNEPVAENYYPVNSIISIEGGGKGLAVVNDRAQGGSSLASGQIELMLHRRMVRDDGRGVGEALSEPESGQSGLTQKMIHKLAFYSTKTKDLPRLLQFNQDTAPIQVYGISASKEFSTVNIEDSLLQQIQVSDRTLTKFYIQQWDNSSYLVRIHNLSELNTISITWPRQCTAKETTLNGLIEWKVMISQRIKWASDINTDYVYQNDSSILPQQIRTFILQCRQ